MNKLVAGSIAVAMFLIAGCATPAPEPTAAPAPIPTPEPAPATNVEDVVGLWTQLKFGARSYLQIEADGTLTLARGATENLQDQPLWIAQTRFEGTKMFIKPTSSVYPDEACVNPTAIYEVQLFEHGNINIVMIEDECEGRLLWLPDEWEPVP